MEEVLYNINIERSVLNSIIFDPAQLSEATGYLHKEDFYLPGHQLIYEAMQTLETKHLPIDEEFIKKEMHGRFEEAVMIDILLANPISNLSNYIAELKEKTQRRSLLGLENTIRKEVHELRDITDIISDSSKSLEEIADIGMNNQEAGTPEFSDRFLDKYSAAQDNNGFTGIKTGLTQVDYLIDGFSGGDLVIIAARPSMGKTSLATSIVINVLEQKKHVLFDSMEMPGEDIMMRFVASRTGESIKDLKQGRAKDMDAVNSALKYFKTNGLYLQDESYVPWAKMKAKALKKLRKNKNIKLWVIDHLRYIKKPGKDINQETSEISKEAKKIAKEYGITVCFLSQLNRVNESRANKRPMLSDLRDSGAVEEDADIVLFPHRENYYDHNKDVKASSEEAEIIVGKARNAQTGTAKCYFIGPTTTFTNSAPLEIEYQYGEETYIMPVITA